MYIYTHSETIIYSKILSLIPTHDTTGYACLMHIHIRCDWEFFLSVLIEREKPVEMYSHKSILIFKESRKQTKKKKKPKTKNDLYIKI